MKVSILVPDLRGGGAERVNVVLARELCARGVDVELIVLQLSGSLIEILPANIKVVELGASRIRDAVLPLTRYLRRERPDALLAAMWPLTIVAILARILARTQTRVVVSEHSTLSLTPVFRRFAHRWIIPWTIRLFYPKADAVIAVSNGVAQDLMQLGNLPEHSIHVVYNPANPDASDMASSNPDFTYWKRPEAAKVIAIGSLKPQKDYPTLLRAIYLLRKVRAVELLILGEGAERVNIENLVSELDLSDVVHLPGFVISPIPYLKSADLFVLASAWEGFGNVIVEALACGIPVVSTDCRSGPSEVLDNGKYGRLVDVRNPEALAEGMNQMLEHPPERRRLVERANEFGADRAARHYYALLRGDQ